MWTSAMASPMTGPISHFHLLPMTHPAATATHAGEAAILLLDCQAHPCLLIYAVLAQTRDAQDVARL